MAQQLQHASSRPIATPSNRELAVLGMVPSHLIEEGSIPEMGTPYRDMPSWSDTGLIQKGYGDYILTLVKGGDSESINFFFGKPKITVGPDGTLVDQSKTPYRKYWKKFGDHRWPPILKNVELVADFSFTRSTNASINGQQGIIIGPTYFERYVFIPDCNEGSKFFIEEFVSPTEFKIPFYRVPLSTGVQYSAPGVSIDFPESLHGDIFFPDLRTSTQVVTSTATFGSSGSLSGASFPRTNFKTWLPYVVYAEQEQDQSCGLWYLQRVRVFPPLRPRTIRR